MSDFMAFAAGHQHTTRVNRIRLSGSHFSLQLHGVVVSGNNFMHNITLNKSN